MITKTDEEIEKMLSDHSHIPDDEVQTDIRDTELEIGRMQVELEAYQKIADLNNDRMAWFRAEARKSGIKERLAFIEKLNFLLTERRKRNDKEIR